MSFPNIPNVTPSISITREDAVNLLLASIAFEELGLAHIINAEGEKIQAVLSTLPGTSISANTFSDVLAADESVVCVLNAVVRKEILLQFKLEEVFKNATTTSSSTSTASTTSTSTTTTSPPTQVFQEKICGNFLGEEAQTVFTAPADDYFEGTFEIFNSASSTTNVTGTVTSAGGFGTILGPVPSGFTMAVAVKNPISFVIDAPAGSSGSFCITLYKRVLA